MKNRYFAFLVCMILSMMWACSETDRDPTMTSEGEKLPDQETWDTSFRVSDRGILEYVIYAGHVQHFGDKQRIQLGDGIRVEFFDGTEGPTSVLTAQEGVLEQHTKNMEAWGDVVITSGDSLQIEAQRIRWDHSMERISAEGAVTIATREGTEYGEGLVFDGRSKTWTMTKVTGRSKEAVKVPRRR